METMAWAANVHARLLDIDVSMTIAFSKKLLEMLDCGSLHEPAMIQDLRCLNCEPDPVGLPRTLLKVAQTCLPI